MPFNVLSAVQGMHCMISSSPGQQPGRTALPLSTRPCPCMQPQKAMLPHDHHRMPPACRACRAHHPTPRWPGRSPSPRLDPCRPSRPCRAIGTSYHTQNTNAPTNQPPPTSPKPTYPAHTQPQPKAPLHPSARPIPLPWQAKAAVLKPLLAVEDNFARAAQAIKPTTEGEAAVHAAYQELRSQVLDLMT